MYADGQDRQSVKFENTVRTIAYKRRFPPGKTCITWDLEFENCATTKPDPEAHFCRGLKMYLLRWEQNYQRDPDVLKYTPSCMLSIKPFVAGH